MILRMIPWCTRDGINVTHMWKHVLLLISWISCVAGILFNKAMTKNAYARAACMTAPHSQNPHIIKAMHLRGAILLHIKNNNIFIALCLLTMQIFSEQPKYEFLWSEGIAGISKNSNCFSFLKKSMESHLWRHKRLTTDKGMHVPPIITEQTADWAQQWGRSPQDVGAIRKSYCPLLCSFRILGWNYQRCMNSILSDLCAMLVMHILSIGE